MLERIEALDQDPLTARLMRSWAADQADVIDEALAIQAIPAPTFEEAARAGFVEQRLAALGLEDVGRDEVGNVYARKPGADAARPAALVSAHLDTVFPADTDLTIRREPAKGQIYGPGLGDNSLGLAALLALARRVQDSGWEPPSDIWWVATVGEEGLGDLRGMRQVTRRLAGRVGLGIVLEGIGLGWVYHSGLGVRRLRITISGPGGHSWLHPAPPSAIHHLMRIGAALVERIAPPAEPLSSFNIGLIEGGTSINTRAPSASMSIDLRSVDPETLNRLDDAVRTEVRRLGGGPDLAVEVEVIGNRPSAELAADHPLVMAAQAVLRALDISPTLSTGSTDANLLLATGIPTVCVGITNGGSSHTLEEYITLEPVAKGMQQITMLTLLAATHSLSWSEWTGW